MRFLQTYQKHFQNIAALLPRLCATCKLLITVILFCSCAGNNAQNQNEKFASLVLDPQTTAIEFFWKDDGGQPFKNIQNLKNYVEKKNNRLRFAMNGGMYESGNLPKGLFIQNQTVHKPLDTGAGVGNFYLQPNGVFYLTTDNRAFVVPTQNFRDTGGVKFATQSGPLLLVDGKINPIFAEDSPNLNIRNGVCILPEGKIVFAISRREVSFYEFARYFQESNCREALYLDGFVSKMYLPEQKIEQLDGDFAVIIGVIE